MALCRQLRRGRPDVTANGDVNGETFDGIYAFNNSAANTGGPAGNDGREVGDHGASNGISARNSGTGALEITANGDVTGKKVYGIYAGNYRSTDTGGMTVTTGADSVIYGRRYGIAASNTGTGAMSVEANGDVTGEDQVMASSPADSPGQHGWLTVTTGVIRSSRCALAASAPTTSARVL